MGEKHKVRSGGRKKKKKKKRSGREFLKGRSQKRRGGEPTKKGIGRKEKREERANKKKGIGRKEKREGRREGRRRGDLNNLMSIGPSNQSRSISNFDITFYSTLEKTGWSPIEISMVGFS